MKRIMTGLLCVVSALALAAEHRDITFLSTSDSHHREPDHKAGNHNAMNRASIEEMNAITNVAWPEKIGGGHIGKPSGVVMLGDCIDDGDRKEGARCLSDEQYKLWLADFGLDGTDGQLKYPVFEGWGNHDGPPVGKEKSGFSFQDHLKKRNLIRKEKGLISNVSSNGLHYSWDWGDVHFVQMNIYPADQQRAGIHYSPVWHDPQGSLTFLKQDLADKVGTNGRPVVLLSHCGFDTDWWVKEDWAAAYEAAKTYNVVLYLYGHTGTGVLQWAPSGEPKKWDAINDGHTDAGFFVVQITDNRLRAAYRTKAGLKVTKKPDGKTVMDWDGQWEWKFLLDRKLH